MASAKVDELVAVVRGPFSITPPEGASTVAVALPLTWGPAMLMRITCWPAVPVGSVIVAPFETKYTTDDPEIVPVP